ncbi:MAG: ATP-binding protein [Cyanobacteria bacterium P01_A01_bin.123]
MANFPPAIYSWPFNSIAWLCQLLGIDQSIAKKIKSGYALALGTAVFGTGCGLLGSYYYAKPAQIQTQQMRQQKQLLSDFNGRLLSIQTHPLRLLAIAGDSRIWMEYETNQFGTDLRQLNRLLDEIEQLATVSSQPDETLIALVNQYRDTLQSYEVFAHSLWENLDAVDEKQIATERLSTALSSASASELSTTFENLSEDLTRLQQTVDKNYDQARAQLARVEYLRLIIILSSMAASIGLAIVLAAITGRAIASPIEQLTQVAHRVTQDNNFQLQAPIQTRDEVSLLTKALNQLVSWIGQYTNELEHARHTLEARVEARTQALRQSESSLRQKAKDLQQTLDELQQTQLQLIQSEKMSSLGQMVAGIAHEINNPVNFIHGNLDHAVKYTEEVMQLLDLYQHSYPIAHPKIQAAIEEIDLSFVQQDFPKLMQSMKDGTTRIRDIVQSLRTFSRLDEAAIKQVNLRDGIESTVTILNNRLKAKPDFPEIRVVRDYGQLPLIECYAGQLNQVFMNILSNAIDAFEIVPTLAAPTITITTQNLDPDWVAIHISDNGPGIPENVCSRLFEPFFTTKAVGKGTGLGLSISYQIVTEGHKGYLGCESIPGQGTEFIIKLPIKL